MNEKTAVVILKRQSCGDALQQAGFHLDVTGVVLVRLEDMLLHGAFVRKERSRANHTFAARCPAEAEEAWTPCKFCRGRYDFLNRRRHMKGQT